MMHVLAQPADSHVADEPDRLRAQRRVRAARRVRLLLILNVIALVLVRLFRDADDFVDWDLIPFLNANTFPSLRQLLLRPELQFRNPFDFSMNVGAESVPSAVLLRGLGHVSLYWSNVLVLLIYDAVFFTLIYLLFSVVFATAFAECAAWSLIAMSPIILTFCSTSAFNMQGYAVIVLGLLGCEYFLQRRPILGTVLLALAFCTMPQGYPLGLFLPYYAICWVVLRAVLAHPRLGTGRIEPIGTLSVAGCLAAIVGMAALVQYWSGGAYIANISPLAQYGPYGQVPPGQWSKFGERAVLFLRQSFLPTIKVDGVVVGFAPYFLYAVLVSLGVLVLWRKLAGGAASPIPAVRSSAVRRLLTVTVAVGAVIFGFLPGFLSQIVKSQRAVFGDLFLVILVAHLVGSLRERRLLRPETIVVMLAVMLFASDAYYSYFTLSVNHSRNHSPVFDFDLSDGVARHDLVAAIDVMREQVEKENASLVIYYPHSWNENHTDPAEFFAQILRHLGRYQGRRDLIFPCRWCEVKYGCPFPAVMDRQCSGTCCFNDPLFEIRAQQRAGKRVYLWWWREPREIQDNLLWERQHQEDLAANWPARLLRRIEHRHTLTRIKLPPPVVSPSDEKMTRPFRPGWICYELTDKS